MKALKKILFYFIIPILVIYTFFVMIAPPIVEKGKNKVSMSPPYQASSQATELFRSLDFVADLHCDALLWKRDLTKRNDYGHVDFPRMQEGNMAFQAFTIVTKSPKGQNFQKNSGDSFDMITALSIGQGQPIKTWFSLVNRAIYQCDKLHKFADNDPLTFMILRSKRDFSMLLARRKSNIKCIGGLLGVEGGHCLEGDIANLQKIYDAGVRMLGPTHFFDNEMGGSAHGITGEGLTEFGMQVIKEMEEKNMILDIAHSSEEIIDDIIDHYTGPIVSSHTGVKGTYDSPRNLSDSHLKLIASKGGLIGIAFFPEAIGGGGIPNIVKAMIYTKNLIGVEHVALGSDFDGSVTVPFDVTGYPLLVEEMLKQGLTTEEIKAIMGENVKRFLLEYL